MLASVFVCTFFVAVHSGQLYQQNSALLLNDILLLEPGHKTAVYLSVCWSPAVVAGIYNRTALPISFLRSHTDVGRLPVSAPQDATTLIVVDLGCAGPLRWLSQVNGSYFKHPMRWLVLNANGERWTESSLWNGIPVWMDSNVLLASWDGESFHLDQGNDINTCIIFKINLL